MGQRWAVQNSQEHRMQIVEGALRLIELEKCVRQEELRGGRYSGQDKGTLTAGIRRYDAKGEETWLVLHWDCKGRGYMGRG